MTWSERQRAELAEQYRRVGYIEGERWPAPPPELTPEELLALFRAIPDGAGRAGYMAALAQRANE